jgi:hypothetical protein
MKRFFLLAVLLLTVAACPGIKEPQISGAAINPTTVPLGGTTTLTFTYDADDDGGPLSYIWWWLINERGSYQATSQDTVYDGPVSIVLTIPTDRAFLGSQTLSFDAVDVYSDVSEILHLRITIVEPGQPHP